MSGDFVEVRVVRSVDMDAVMRGAMRLFFEDAMNIMHNNAVEWAPVRQREMRVGRGKNRTIKSGRGNKQSGGLLRSSIAPGRGVTTFGDDFAKVGTRLALHGAGGRVPYGLYLDDQDNTGKYHYRSGPHQGQVTTGWLTGSADRAKSELDESLKELAGDIEAGWRKG